MNVPKLKNGDILLEFYEGILVCAGRVSNYDRGNFRLKFIYNDRHKEDVRETVDCDVTVLEGSARSGYSYELFNGKSHKISAFYEEKK